MDTTLVTGVHRTIGSNLALAWEELGAVVGWAPLGSRVPAGLEVHGSEPGDATELAMLVASLRPTTIVHCPTSALSAWDIDGAALDENAECDFVALLGRSAADVQARFVVLSSDAVFCGPRLFHDEESTGYAMSATARTLRVIEAAARRAGALVLRTHAYGWNPDPSCSGYAERLWTALQGGVGCTVDADAYATPLLASDLAQYVQRLATRPFEKHEAPLLHLAGAERTSMARFATELAAAMPATSDGPRHAAGPLHGPSLVNPSALPGVYASEARIVARETSLSTTTLRRRSAMPLPMLREGLARFAQQASGGFRQRVQTTRVLSPALLHAA